MQDLKLARSLSRTGSLALLSALGSLGLVLGCSPGGIGGGAGGDAMTSGKSAQGTTTSGTGGDFTGSVGATGGGSSSCAPGMADLSGCACSPGSAPRDCYDGPAQMAGVGACTRGMQECKTVNMNEFMGGVWQPCIGSGKPSAEVCDGKGDEDCDGAVDNGCGCTEGASQMCKTPDGNAGTQTCLMGQWGPCGCVDGTVQACLTAQGESGTQSCVNQGWTPCVGSTCGGNIAAGQPCAPPGTSIATPPNTCGCGDQGTAVSALYCDGSGVWQCFPADDCNPAACAPCLQMHCSQFMSSPNAACQANLTTATTFLEGCGPDRNAWFSNLDQACPSGEVSQLNQCKFQYCVMNGTCSFY